jgi:hypothetical protein
VCNLVIAGSLEISFLLAEFSKESNCFVTTFISIGFEFRPSNRDIALSIPDISAEVELLGDSPIFGLDYRYGSQSSRPSIDTENILATLNIELLAEINSHNPMVSIIGEPEICANITIGDKCFVSFISTILRDRNGESAVQGCHRDNGVAMLGDSELATTGDIETHRDIIDAITVIFVAGNDILYHIFSELRLKSIIRFDSSVDDFMDIESRKSVIRFREFIPILADLKDNLAGFRIFPDEDSEFRILPRGQREGVQFQSLNNFDHVSQGYIDSRVYKGSEGVAESSLSVLLPALNNGVSEPDMGIAIPRGG